MMTRTILRLATSAMALMASGAAFAQLAPPAPDTVPEESTSSTQANATAGEPASAAVDPAGTDDDIIVTAQKRAENLQRVPLAVSAFNGATLQQRNIVDVTQVANLVPNVNVQQRLSYGVITIRGIGFDQLTVGAEASVAVHQDGVYIARPTGALAGFFDVERVEVSRGPQGTLYGRNSTGGAANIISRKPTELTEGYVTIGGGNYNALNVEAAMSGALAGPTLLGRIAVKLDDRDGYGKNEFNGDDIDDLNSRGIRGQLQWKPSSTFSALLEADYYRQKDSAFALQFDGTYVPCPPSTTFPACATSLGGQVARGRRNVNNNVQPQNKREFYGFTGTLDWDLNSDLHVRSISALRKGDTSFVTDADNSNIPLLFVTRNERNTQKSEELQLLGDYGRFNFILGGFYFHDRTRGIPQGSWGPLTGRGVFLQGGLIRTNAAAVFGQATYDLTDQFSLTLGGRYSHEKKSLSEEVFFPGLPVPNPFLGLTRSVRFNSFTPKFGAEFKPNDNILVFANIQKGFKSGGYSVGALTPAFQPETIWSYEGGIKTSFGRTRLNLTAFHYDYSNVQVGRIESVVSVISNAASANVNGVEFEADVRLTDTLRADLVASYLDSTFAQYTTRDPGRLALGILDLSGNTLAQAPKFTGNLGLQNSWRVADGELTLRGEGFRSSRVYFSPFNLESFSQKRYELFNAFLNYRTGPHWTASIFVRNVANKFVKAGGYVSSGLYGFPRNVSLLPPRTVGAKIGYQF